MSIGKSSIARAVSSTTTAVKTQTKQNSNVSINKFSLDKIGLLSVEKTSCDLNVLKTSVKNRGILCPVLVAATANGDIWLIDGYARVAVAQELEITTIDAIVVNVQNKSQANHLYNEINKAKPQTVKSDVKEEKFRVLCVKDRDLPTYLL